VGEQPDRLLTKRFCGFSYCGEKSVTLTSFDTDHAKIRILSFSPSWRLSHEEMSPSSIRHREIIITAWGQNTQSQFR